MIDISSVYYESSNILYPFNNFSCRGLAGDACQWSIYLGVYETCHAFSYFLLIRQLHDNSHINTTESQDRLPCQHARLPYSTSYLGYLNISRGFGDSGIPRGSQGFVYMWLIVLNWLLLCYDPVPRGLSVSWERGCLLVVVSLCIKCVSSFEDRTRLRM